MTVRKEELKFREFDRYRAFYCGLCRAIGQRCGRVCRMALSFEMTFLAMLLTALYESDTTQELAAARFILYRSARCSATRPSTTAPT